MCTIQGSRCFTCRTTIFPFVRIHRRTLAIGTKNKKSVYAAGHKPFGELAHELLIDPTIIIDPTSISPATVTCASWVPLGISTI